MNPKIDIPEMPEIAKGTKIPPQISYNIAKEEQLRKESKRRDIIAEIALIVAILSLVVSVVALFLK